MIPADGLAFLISAIKENFPFEKFEYIPNVFNHLRYKKTNI